MTSIPGPHPNEATTAKSGGIAKVPPKAKADVPLSKITMAKADEFGPAADEFR